MKKLVNEYKIKIVKSGKLIQKYIYSQPLRKGYKIEPNEFKGLIINEETGEVTKKPKATEKLEKYKNRIINNLVRTINCNVNKRSKFITLTFKESIQDLETAQKYFKSFLTAFKREFGFNLEYVAVRERQKKRGLKEHNEGAWHYHLIVFNKQFLKFERLKKCWSRGSVDVKRIDKVDNIGRYMSKYLWKDIDLIKPGKHSILKSKGLLKPTVEYLASDIDIKKEPSFSKAWVCLFPNLNGDLVEGLCIMNEYIDN